MHKEKQWQEKTKRQIQKKVNCKNRKQTSDETVVVCLRLLKEYSFANNK